MSYGSSGVGGMGGSAGGGGSVDPELKRFLEVESKKAQFQVCVAQVIVDKYVRFKTSFATLECYSWRRILFFYNS